MSAKGIYDDTPVDSIPAKHEQAYQTFLSGKTRDIAWRKRQIKQLGFLIQDNEDKFVKALEADFGRPAFETITGEINPAKQEINEVYDHLDKWSKPVRVKTTFAWKGVKPTVYQEPKGEPSRTESAHVPRGRADPFLRGRRRPRHWHLEL